MLLSFKDIHTHTHTQTLTHTQILIHTAHWLKGGVYPVFVVFIYLKKFSPQANLLRADMSIKLHILTYTYCTFTHTHSNYIPTHTHAYTHSDTNPFTHAHTHTDTRAQHNWDIQCSQICYSCNIISIINILNTPGYCHNLD